MPVLRAAFPFAVVAALWELVAHSGAFPRRLFPPLEEIAATLARLTVQGILPHHAAETLFRLALGFAIAAVAGVLIGILMGRYRRAEDLLLPLVSIGAPIPGLAYAPLFLLWFGLGDTGSIVLVAFVSAFSVTLNTWTGEGREGDLAARGADHGRGRAPHVPLCDPAGRAALHPHRLAPRPRAGLAHPGGGGDAGRGALGPRLADLRRARVPQHRRDARRHRRDRPHRPRAGEVRLPAARALHRGALGDGGGMRAALSLLAFALLYEAVARSGWFAQALVPTLPMVARTLWAMLADGSMA